MKLFAYISMFIWFSYLINIPKSHLKKIDKEVYMLFDITSYDKVHVELDPEVLAQMSANFNTEGFYRIVKEGESLGYFYFGKAPSKADEFDYVVFFDNELIVKKIKILAYREDYGGEISSKRWLRQFDGLSAGVSLKYGDDVKGISGATISARSMTTAVNQLLTDLSRLP